MMKKMLWFAIILSIAFFIIMMPEARAAGTQYYLDTQGSPDWAWDSGTGINWWTNSGHSVPAGAIPSAGDTVYIDGEMDTGPSIPIDMAHIYVGANGGGSFGVSLGQNISSSDDVVFLAATHNVGGTNLNMRFGVPEGTDTAYNSPGAYGMTMIFYANTYNQGGGGNNIFHDTSYQDTMAQPDEAHFYDYSYNLATGNNGASFHDYSYNQGIVGSPGSYYGFHDHSYNDTTGVVNGDSILFNDSSYNKGEITGDAEFNDNSHNSGTVMGGATFNDSAYGNGGVIHGSVTLNTTGDVTISTVMDGEGMTLTMAGTGTVSLSGANTYTGATSINGGTLQFSKTASLYNGDTADWTAANIKVASGGTVAFNVGGVNEFTTGNVTTLLTNLKTITSNGLQAGSAIGFDTTNSGGSFTIADNIANSTGTGSGAVGVTKLGTNTLTLSGANTYTGLTSITAGTLSVNTVFLNNATAQSLGENAALSISGGGTLKYTGAAGTLGKTITIATGSSGIISNTGTGTLTLSGGIVKSGSTLTLTGTNAITVDTVGISGALASSDLIVDDVTVNLNVANTYTGPTYIRSTGTAGLGILNANVAGALPTGTRTAVTMDDSGAGSSQLALGASQSIASLTGASSSRINLNADTLTIGTTAGSTTFAGIISGTNGVLAKDGASTLVLSGANAYSGGTTVNAGTLTCNGSSALGATTGALSVNNPNTGAGIAVTLNLSTTAATTTGSLGGAIATPSSGTNTVTINNGGQLFTVNQTAAGAYAGVIAGTGGFTLGSLSTNTLTLSGANTYSGGTNISAGTLNFANGSLGSSGTVDFTGSSTLQWATGNTQDLSSRMKIDDGVTATLDTQANNVSFASALQTGVLETGAFTKTGSGTLTISGANTYTGATTINAGTLALNGNCGLSGNLTLAGTGTLSIGANTLTLAGTGVYNQTTGQTLDLNITNPSTYGNIQANGASGITGGTVNVVLSGAYIANGTTFTVVNNTGGTTIVPTINKTGDSHISLTGSDVAGDLVLTASRTSGGFASFATNPNQAGVGNVLDNVTNPTADMTTILNILEGLNPSQTASALNSMEPDTDGAALQITQATLDQLTDAVLGHQESLRGTATGDTGVSTGSDTLKGLDVWAQAFGSYIHQDPRQLSQGYNAGIWGTALGFDIPAIKDIRVGTCFGFAHDYIRGKDSSNRNDVNAYQWTIYGEYTKDALYIDLSGAFAFNTYDASRQVAVGPIQRTASGSYNGEQYQVYTEAGYTFNCKKDLKSKFAPDLNITPIASFQYEHLALDKYTESGAGALNLSVKAQNYDFAQTGIGLKLDYPVNTKCGQLVPELRFKWLYDWIGDAQANTSSFTGGGGSFATNGFSPAQSTWNFGAKLTMFTKNNWTCAVNYDLELKEDFYGHYGYVNAKYSF